MSRIVAFNRGRDPDRLRRKYAAMRADPFTFFRGTCHLFYEDWPARTDSTLDSAPRAWVSGDLHLENFGTFRGDNRLTYFDLNDFDEGALAPATWELARFATSVLVAAVHLRLEDSEAVGLARRYLAAYRAALRNGKAGWVERATARGVVKRLLDQVRKRTNAELLDVRTELVKGKRRLVTNGRRALACDAPDRMAVVGCLAEVAARSPDTGYFEVIDVARRVAGTGSLGLPRWVVLIRGDGGVDGNVLLDVKAAQPAVIAGVARRRGIRQPDWPSEAVRVIAVQERAQAASPALLQPVSVAGLPCILRALQPLEDRLRFEELRTRPARLRSALKTMGRVTAWAMLRSASRQSAAGLDEWVAWAADARWEREVLSYARAYRRTVLRDWKAFSAAHEENPLPA